MINRLFAMIALTARRMDSASSYTEELRSAAFTGGDTRGLSAAATTRW